MVTQQLTNTFTVHTIPEDVLEHARALAATGTDAQFELFAMEDTSPMRCCNGRNKPGERVVLFSYTPPGTAGPYRETGPVFIHAEPCAGPARPGQYPDENRGSPHVMRAYDYQGRIVRGVLDDGSASEATIEALFADPEVAQVHCRALGHGCFHFAMTRNS